MPVQRLKDYLDENGVKFVSIKHSEAYTAQEVAASAHIPGKDMAKTVMTKIDGRLAMAVVPASHKVDFQRLCEVAGAQQAELAAEMEFKDRFPACDVGAMPPFGNLYDVNVYVSSALAEDLEISFNAGSHSEIMRLAYADFERLVNPTVGSFSSGLL